ncbi:MAG: type III toxin-antitoxin system ToxN/AbiQ family toxin, partial [Firmicutes bacterium]|nr:type III toxin-antitoxin system ToxN/AbiQ family toxin [Bacillota bacterium]
MGKDRLKFYNVNMKYIRNLHNQGDDHVFSVSPQTGKLKRPFVGIVVICSNKEYCIPLSSPKKKHINMRNRVDFHKIVDEQDRIIGVLDINDMIPVRADVLNEIDLKIYPGDSVESKRYKKLLIKQLRFCRKNQDIIVAKANTLYNMIGDTKASRQLKRRCLNWKKLER